MADNKLQIRVKILSAITNMQQNYQDREFIKNTLNELSKIEDKDTVASILSKEFLKENSETKDWTISFLLRELVPEDMLDSKLFDLLASPRISDALKAKIVEVLRDNGKHVSYDNYAEFFQNPDEIIDADTIRLLENAKINPESQIDFMDFMHALPEDEKDVLLTSLTVDYDGDNLANILAPIALSSPYSEIGQKTIKALGESKSYLAYPVLKYLADIVDEPSIQNTIQKSLNLLRIAGIKGDVTKGYFQKILSDSPVYKCVMNFPDGHGNTGIIFSRKNAEGYIKMFALVINDIDGIIDCFGFNQITDVELDRILSKFYLNEKAVEITPEECRCFIENAEKLSRLKFQEISYEYICWKSLLYDIQYNDIDFTAELEKIEMNDELLQKLYQTNYLDKWFFETNDSEGFKNLTNKIYEAKNPSADYFLEEIQNFKDEIYSTGLLQTLNKRLYVSAYLAKKSLDEFNANLLYSLSKESEIKQIFLTDMLRRSIYDYFLALKEKYESLENTTSIFAKKNTNDIKNLDIDFIKKSIQSIEEKWV